jgi:hypothetical protein
MRGRAFIATLVAAVSVGIQGPAAAAATEPDFSRIPLWVYGHSYTTDPGEVNTPGKEWMPDLARSLRSPSWRTFGVGSSRIIDTYGDIARQASRSPVAGSAWTGSRRGAVVLQSEFNDAINPAFYGATSSRTLSRLAAGNYGQTLQASLALLSSRERRDWSTSTARGAWRSSSGPAYLGGSLTYTTTPGAYREMKVNVGASGTAWLVTWEVSSRIANPRTGTTSIAVDGRVRSVIPPRAASWEAIWSRRGAAQAHAVGPRATALTGLTPGWHTVRVTKGDRGPGAVYLDQLAVQSDTPVPVVVVKDPPALTKGKSWVTRYAGTVAANRRLLHQQIDSVVHQSPFAHVTTATLDGIRPEHYGYDGVHLSDAGMRFEATRLETVLRSHLRTHRSAAMYR